MPQSLANVLLHIVFSTKNRVPYLRAPDLRQDLYAYMSGIHSNHGCPALLINGVEDHIHILCQLGRTIAIADLIREIKTASSEWVKSQPSGPKDFNWQSGYGVFSVSQSNVEAVRDYVARQEEHHRKKTFQDELRALLRRHGVEFDERYVWD